jgi:outer membrane biosynthesis protein TonB
MGLRRIQADNLARQVMGNATDYALRTVNPLLAKVGVGTTREEPAPAPESETKPAPRTPPRATPRPRATPVVTQVAAVTVDPEHGPFSDSPAGENAPLVGISALDEGPTVTLLEAGFSGRVFSELDEGVSTPRPLQPMLAVAVPRGFGREDLGVAEYIVDHRGYVESVKLIKESSRFQDRMVLSVIKAWRFEPAYKDGQPVRYRQSIVLTQ